VGGSNRSIALQPVSLEGSVVLNVVAGFVATQIAPSAAITRRALVAILRLVGASRDIADDTLLEDVDDFEACERVASGWHSLGNADAWVQCRT
jgi:hypothetical protein